MPELKRRSEIPETLGNVFFYTLTYKVKNGTVSLSICKCLKMLHHSSERLLQCLNADEGGGSTLEVGSTWQSRGGGLHHQLSAAYKSREIHS